MPAQTVRVLVDGQPYTVEIEDTRASPLVVRVNGKSFTVELPPVTEPGAPAAWQARAGDGAGRTTLSGNGKPSPQPTPPTVRPAPSGLGSTVIAPMPGTILAIFVEAGQQVAYKQDLCILEAMKMKNVIRSPRAGTVAEVRVHPGQTVAYGEVLLTFG